MSPWEPRRPADEHDDSPYDDTPSPEGSPTPETSDMSRTPTPDLPRLSDEDLEQLLRGAFEERTRAEVPDDRVPPAIEWPSARAARRTWLTPLAVAASIAAVAAGGGLVLAQQHRTDQAPPATQTVTAEPTSASPTSSTGTKSATATGTATGSATGTATGTVTATGTTAPPVTSTAPSSTTAAAQRVTAGGATLTVPAGYTFRRETSTTGGGTPISPTWCFDTQGTSDCAISFIEYDAAANPLDSDSQGGYAANPQYCGPGGGSNGVGLTAYDEQTWGGRAAERRVWKLACPSGQSVDIAQYTVITPQAYGLFSDQATAAVQAAMAQVVGGSSLPAATSSTRLYDRGYLRSATPTSGGTTVTIDRVISGRPNTGTQVYTYVIPTSVYPTDNLQKAVGTLITVQTNGSVATGVVLPGG